MRFLVPINELDVKLRIYCVRQRQSGISVEERDRRHLNSASWRGGKYYIVDTDDLPQYIVEDQRKVTPITKGS